MILVVITLLLSQNTFSHAEEPRQGPRFKAEGEIGLGVTTQDSKGFGRDVELNSAWAQVEAMWYEGVKTIVALEVRRHLLRAGPRAEGSHFSIESALTDAYIEIETDKLTGGPRAIVKLGKHQMAFGQEIAELPFYDDRQIYPLGRQGEVIGFTVQLPTEFLQIVDEVAVSMFESGADDLRVQNQTGGSVTLTKQVTEQLRARVSGLYKQSVDPEMRAERRGGIGLVYEAPDKSWKVYSEGYVFEHNPDYLKSGFATQIGTSWQFGKGMVVMEHSYIENQAHELSLGYKLPIGEYFVLAPEIRKTFSLDKDNVKSDLRFGVRGTVYFKTPAQ